MIPKTDIMKPFLTVAIAGLATLSSCAQQSTATDKIKKDNNYMTTQPNTAIATFANGCFWCTEAIFEELDGVISAVSGYTGGQTPNPTYKEVSNGETGHAECLQIT